MTTAAERIWKAYPKKRGHKQRSLGYIQRGIDDVGADVMLSQVEAWVASEIRTGTEYKYWPNGETFFSARRWQTDEPIPPDPAPKIERAPNSDSCTEEQLRTATIRMVRERNPGPTAGKSDDEVWTMFRRMNGHAD